MGASNFQNHRGFTFIEIMITLVVLAISSTIVVSMYSGNNMTKLRAAAQMLASDLAYAQIASVTHEDKITGGANHRIVVLDPDNNRYYIAINSEPDTPIDYPLNPSALYETVFGRGRADHLTNITISNFDFDGDNILEFGPYGELDQTTPATITLACQNQTITLTIHPSTGQITITN